MRNVSPDGRYQKLPSMRIPKLSNTSNPQNPHSPKSSSKTLGEDPESGVEVEAEGITTTAEEATTKVKDTPLLNMTMIIPMTQVWVEEVTENKIEVTMKLVMTEDMTQEKEEEMKTEDIEVREAAVRTYQDARDTNMEEAAGLKGAPEATAGRL